MMKSHTIAFLFAILFVHSGVVFAILTRFLTNRTLAVILAVYVVVMMIVSVVARNRLIRVVGFPVAAVIAFAAMVYRIRHGS